MAISSGESVVRSFFAAMNAQDAEAATALARADVTIVLGPEQLAGHEALRALALQTDDQLTSEWVPDRLSSEGAERVDVEALRIQRWRTSGEVASQDDVHVRFALDGAGAIARIEIG